MSDHIKEILEYAPPVVERQVTSSIQEDESNTENHPIGGQNNCIDDLKANAPSACLKRAEEAISKAKTMINGIVDSYAKDPDNFKKVKLFKQALENDDYSSIDKFESVVIKDKAGDPKLEVLAPLYYMNNTMEKMKDLMTEKAYGSSVNYDTAVKLDNDMFSIIDQSERDETQLTNYSAVSLDAIIGNGMNNYFGDCLNFMDAIQDIIEPIVDIGPVSIPEDLKSIMEATFEREVAMSIKDGSQLRQADDSGFKEQLAINMYEARETLLKNETVGMSILSMDNSPVTDSFMKQLQESTTEALSIILDFHKHSIMEAMYREDFVTTLERKQGVRKLFG